MATFQRMIFKGDASGKIYPLYLLEDKKRTATFVSVIPDLFYSELYSLNIK